MLLCDARENVLRSDPKHHRVASDAQSVVTFLYGLVVEAITLNVLVSTKLEEVLTEMKLPAFYEEVSRFFSMVVNSSGRNYTENSYRIY